MAPIPGRRRAEIVFRRAPVAVYVNGCFWHGCPEHWSLPLSNRGFWEAKIAYDRRRDKDTDRQLAEHGWRSVRVWEHELAEQVTQKIAAIIRQVGACRTNKAKVAAEGIPGEW
ncbi:very short patch repair endonuclease [Corallococcus terminator]